MFRPFDRPFRSVVSVAVALALGTGSLLGQEPPPFQLQVDYSPFGMVSSAQPLATWAGVQILEAGGNAADAAVAAAFAIAVVEPSMNSIGGRTQILVRLPNGEVRGIDATTQAPWSYDASTAPTGDYGYPQIGVPGAVAGLTRLLEEHGTFPLDRVMAPAIRLAEEGFRVLPAEAARQASQAGRVAEFEGSRESFLKPDGSPYAAGDLMVQPVLANTLKKIAVGGAEVFYRGEIAQAMVADMEAHGAAVTLESLAEYRAEDATVVRGTYRGYGLVGTYVPAAGAQTIEALHILETLDLRALSAAERAVAVGQALTLAAQDWRLQGPPEMAAQLTSKAWAAERAVEITVGSLAPAREGGIPGTASGERALDLGSVWERLPRGNTTHLSTADSDGMMVALTQTLGPLMGSKVATPGLGFLYAATLGGGYLRPMAPGERAATNISPFLVLKDGDPVLILGAAGGGMIPVAIVNAIVHFVDGGLPFPEAVTAPRVAGGLGGPLSMETHEGPGWTAFLVDQVRALGIEVREVNRTGAFGRIHGIRYFSGSGQWEGVADPDWEGTALGVRHRPRGR